MASHGEAEAVLEQPLHHVALGEHLRLRRDLVRLDLPAVRDLLVERLALRIVPILVDPAERRVVAPRAVEFGESLERLDAPQRSIAAGTGKSGVSPTGPRRDPGSSSASLREDHVEEREGSPRVSSSRRAARRVVPELLLVRRGLRHPPVTTAERESTPWCSRMRTMTSRLRSVCAASSSALRVEVEAPRRARSARLPFPCPPPVLFSRRGPGTFGQPRLEAFAPARLARLAASPSRWRDVEP